MMKGLAIVATWLLLCGIALGTSPWCRQNAQERAGLEMVERPLVL